MTVFHAGRGRRTPKIGACARACMSVQDARRCSRYTPTSLCSPVTFAEAVFSLPPSSFSFQHRFFSPSFAPIPSNTSSLLFFFPLALFSTLLLPLSSLLATRFEDSVSRFVARNRGRERERKGVYFARVYTGRFLTWLMHPSRSERGAWDCSFLRSPSNRFMVLLFFILALSFFFFFYLVSFVLEILRDLRGTVRSLGKGFSRVGGEV